MRNKVGNVYSTSDYSVFKKLDGNRGIMEKRKNLLIRSIQERGWIRNPIVVNENMEVIDGQGRLEALRELGMPVEYVIARGATLSDCIALNVKQTNWTNTDYVKSYAEMGYEDYKILLSHYGVHHHLPDTCVNTIVSKDSGDCGTITTGMKEGNFKVFDKETVNERLEFADRCVEILGKGYGRLRQWCYVFKFVWYCKKINTELFMDRLLRNKHLVTPCVTTKQMLECLELIYNYGCKRENKVYFIPEWDLFIREMKEV